MKGHGQYGTWKFAVRASLLRESDMTSSFLLKFTGALIGVIIFVVAIDMVGDMLMQPRAIADYADELDTDRVSQTDQRVSQTDQTEQADQVDEVVPDDGVPVPAEDETDTDTDTANGEALGVVEEDDDDDNAGKDAGEDEGVDIPEDVASADDENMQALVANADATKGARSARKCTTCHTFTLGGANKIGPALAGVIGREVASVDGFRYSDAMAAKGGVWTLQALDDYLRDPPGVVKGTNMAFGGIRKEEERLDLLKYIAESSRPD